VSTTSAISTGPGPLLPLRGPEPYEEVNRTREAARMEVATPTSPPVPVPSGGQSAASMLNIRV
jgi:hypothetical protein